MNRWTSLTTLSPWALATASVALSAFAQLSLRQGMSRPATQSALEAGGGTAAWAVASQPFVLLGLALYALGALVWLLVLARLDVTRAYPFVGLGFVLVATLGAMLLGETLTPARVVGTLLVVSGVLCVALGR